MRKINASLLLSLLVMAWSRPAGAHQHFNPLALHNDGAPAEDIDLSVFDNGGQAAGNYRVEVYINTVKIITQTIAFHPGADQRLQPCLHADQLAQWGINTALWGEEAERQTCFDLNRLSGATAEFAFAQHRLDLHLPQSALQRNPHDAVAEALWDEGINAFLLNYSLSGSQQRDTRNHDGTSQHYASLLPGLNLGAWRLRNYTTWDQGGENHPRWRAVYSYAWRDLKALRGRLLVGDYSSASDVFDGIAFRGVQVSSDEEMQPDSLRGYAPVIRGIARRNARVSVEQNGYVIYRTEVPAGPFEINDLYATGGSGDLLVTLHESDGSEQQLRVPYASVPVLQREGHLKYSLTVGRTRPAAGGRGEESFAEVTALYGLRGGLTLYGGTQTTPGKEAYRAMQLGSGVNLGRAGALSLDVTHARSRPEAWGSQSGEAWRVRYSKNMQATGTQISLAVNRYSSGGYASLQERLTREEEGAEPLALRRRRELTLAQATPCGSLSLTLLQETYRHSPAMLSLGAGYNNVWHEINYGLSYIWSGNAASDRPASGAAHQQQLSLNVSVPLSHFLPSTYATYTLNAARPGDTAHTLGLNGTALRQNNLSWSIQQGYNARGGAASGSLNAALRGRYADLSGGYSYDPHQRRVNYAMQGGLMLHRDGLTLSQPLDETAILIKAPGAANLRVSNSVGVSTDGDGFAIVPYATPWHRNEVTLGQSERGGENIELLESSQTVIPTRGAVVRAEYKTNIGGKALMILTRANNEPVPFGATVSLMADGENHPGLVGDRGQVWLTGLQTQGTLLATWGSSRAQRCEAAYRLPEKRRRRGVAILPLRCRQSESESAR